MVISIEEAMQNVIPVSIFTWNGKVHSGICANYSFDKDSIVLHTTKGSLSIPYWSVNRIIKFKDSITNT